MNLLLDFGSFRLSRTLKRAWTTTLKTTSAWLTVFILGAAHFQTMTLILPIKVISEMKTPSVTGHDPSSTHTCPYVVGKGKINDQIASHDIACFSIDIRLHTINSHWTCTVIALVTSSIQRTSHGLSQRYSSFLCTIPERVLTIGIWLNRLVVLVRTRRLRRIGGTCWWLSPIFEKRQVVEIPLFHDQCTNKRKWIALGPLKLLITKS